MGGGCARDAHAQYYSRYSATAMGCLPGVSTTLTFSWGFWTLKVSRFSFRNSLQRRVGGWVSGAGWL